MKLTDLPRLPEQRRVKPINIALYPEEIRRLQVIGGGGTKRTRNTGIVAGIRRLLAMVEDDSDE
jgi:hypothetical protein